MTGSDKSNVKDMLESIYSWTSGYKVSLFDSKTVFEDDEEVQVVNTSESMEENNALVTQDTPGENDKLLRLSEKVSLCKNCILSSSRSQTVFGQGVKNPYVLVIGENPSAEDEAENRPFAGSCGELLDKMLAAINLSRNKNCYLTTVVKCRPPMNRAPMNDEASACEGFLQAQINILKPSFILVFGRSAVQNLLKTGEGLATIHGKWFEYNSIPLMATFDPSTLLREPEKKAAAWNDLKIFRSALLQKNPEYAGSPD